MIENRQALGAALALLLLVSGCGRATHVPAGLQGLVEYDEHVVSFEVAGRVERIDVHRGDTVTADQTVTIPPLGGSRRGRR